MKYLQALSLSCCLFLSSGCGDASAIKRYNYETTKGNLEQAVIRVIHANPNIIVDTAEPQVTVRRNPGDPKDTSTKKIDLSDFHDNDSASTAAYFSAYVKIKIQVDQHTNSYTFRYLGDEQHWKTSASSAIFISEISDGDGNSISQGHNENGQFESKMAKEFTEVFEREVVDKIDSELKLKHAV